METACAAVAPEARDTAKAAVQRAMMSGIARGPGRRGFASLGGLHAQKHALRELVALPLQVRSAHGLHLTAIFPVPLLCAICWWQRCICVC